MKTTTQRIKSFLVGALLISTTGFSQCPLGNQFATAVAPVQQGQLVTISTCSFLGEYSPVTNLVAGSTYTVNIAQNNGVLGNFFITVYNPTDSTVVTSGSAPLSFTPPNSGTYNFQWNGVNCTTANTCHSTIIELGSGGQAMCSGPVAGGSAAASVGSICSGNPFQLSLVGQTTGPGITLQWQSSADGLTYANIPNATSATFTASQNVQSYYQCVVTCAGANISATSTSVAVAQDLPANCVCLPQYTNGCTDNDIIGQVVLNTMTNNSGLVCLSGNLGYSDYTNDASLTTQLFYGQNYNLEVSCGMFSQGVAAWIDYNDDGVFDNPSERIAFGNVQGNSTISMPFTISNSVNAGNLKMRVRSVFGTQPNMITPCGLYTWGETEDYTVFVAGDSTYACINGSVYCDNNDNGILDAGDVELANAPFILNYNGMTEITQSNSQGNFFFGIEVDSNATSATVSVDAAWLAQNGIQYTNNSITTTNLQCTANSPTLNFPVNCDSSDIQTSCAMGIVFCDPNGNGVLDSGEVVIPNVPIAFSNGVTVYTDSLGVYTYSGGQNPSGYLDAVISQTWLANNGFELLNNTFTTSTACDSLEIVNVGINCSPILCSNLWTTVSPWMGYFQNQNNQILLNWGNYGPNLSSGFTLNLTFPTDVTPVLTSISNPNYSISGNTISWTFPAGNYSSYNSDFISFFVPPIFPSGTPHTYASTIDARGAVADCDSSNNVGMLTMILGNSYDPNDKSVSHPPMINPDEDEELTYVIRFQNTGTAPAQDVYILDTLSSYLDWSSLKVINASHYMQLIDLGNGVMKFNFPGIWLPDSTSNEPESHGKVIFSIKENAFNPLNSVIENTGYIYFDWNEAIITNTTYNINAYPVSGINELGDNLVSVHPNPFNSNVQIVSSKLMDNIAVYDVTGQLIHNETVNSLSKSIDLSTLSQGVYLLKVNAGGEISTVRIVKK